MWKYVSRRIRDSIERSANYFDKRSTTGLANAQSNGANEDSKKSSAPCCWITSAKCWRSHRSDYNTNNNRWNFEQLNGCWLGAITWSSALVLGWYTSQLIHLKYKYLHRNQRNDKQFKDLFKPLTPYVHYVNKNALFLESIPEVQKVINSFTPTVYSVSNDQLDQAGTSKKRPASTSSGSESNASSDDLGDVLNSIENRLGLAAIENGQHQDGINLLRSAANRNHSPALYNLGLCYELGLGVAADEKMAMELYRAAASLEHAGAMYNLGIYYGQGRGGLTPDTNMATRLLRLAALKGQESAIAALKALDIETIESPKATDSQTFSYPFTPYAQSDLNIVPTHSSFFVDVNLTQVNGDPVY